MSYEEISENENSVTSWLSNIGCKDLSETFLDNGYRNLEIISEMTKEDLKEIGIEAGFAKTILIHAAKLKNKPEAKITETLEIIKKDKEDLIPIKKKKMQSLS